MIAAFAAAPFLKSGATDLVAPALPAAEQSIVRGLRWQILSAMRLMAAGELLLFFNDGKHLEPIGLGGTRHHAMIAGKLVESGWIEKKSMTHWVRHIEIFSLSEAGRCALDSGQRWWNSLSVPEKFLIAITE